MGAKGRKRLQRKKAKNRTGLLKSLTGPDSANQHDKRQKIKRELWRLKKLMGF